MSICGGIAGRRAGTPSGVVLHNDAGSRNATAEFYKNWLPNHDLTNGFAHEYVCSDGIIHAEDYENMAWHTATQFGNANYIGIEVCQSMGDLAIFQANEQKSFKLAADILKKYGLKPSLTTVKLHREFVATSCPHRSWEIHNKAVEAVRSYFIEQINKYMNTTQATTNKTETKLEEIEMDCIVINKGTQYWYSATGIVALTHPDEVGALKQVYQAANGKKEIPVCRMEDKWFNRLKDVAKRKAL